VFERRNPGLEAFNQSAERQNPLALLCLGSIDVAAPVALVDPVAPFSRLLKKL
jgi:hypothetical protein